MRTKSKEVFANLQKCYIQLPYGKRNARRILLKRRPYRETKEIPTSQVPVQKVQIGVSKQSHDITSEAQGNTLSILGSLKTITNASKTV